jgi:hypothetical protein
LTEQETDDVSISSMTNAAMSRRRDAQPPTRPATFSEMAVASRGSNLPESNVAAALEVITTYIPTEVLTLYVAVLAAIRAPGPALPGEWVAFGFFLVATPVVVWLLYAAKVKAAGKDIPLPPRKWPQWEMSAGMVSFLAWAFALPEAPFREFSWYSSALGGVIVLVVSAGLGLVAPLFQRPLPT